MSVKTGYVIIKLNVLVKKKLFIIFPISVNDPFWEIRFKSKFQFLHAWDKSNTIRVVWKK